MQTEIPDRRDAHFNRKLEQVAARVMLTWFPANLDFLTRVRKSLTDDDKYGVELLLEDLKRDFALLTFCLKTVLQQTNAHAIPAEDRSNPIAILRWAGYDRLAAIVLNEHSGLPTYRNESAGELQTQRTQESMNSASAIEVLSGQFSLDSEVGFSAGLLRQLGVTLIAWNFQKEYEEAVAIVQSGRMGLDDAVTRGLGFSPKLLGQRIIRDWGLGEEIEAVIDSSPTSRRKNLSFESGFMLKLCDIGEAFARANSPKIYPNAKQQWEKSKEELSDSLGDNGCDQLEKKFKEKAKAYNPFSREYQLIKKHGHDPRRYGYRLMQENRYLARCPVFLKQALESVYLEIHSKDISEAGLIRLAKEIIPSIGFENGCIFLVKPDTLTLVPRFQIGSLPLERFRTLDCMTESVSDPVVSAYFARFPIMLTGQGQSGTWTTHLTGPIGRMQPAGVLYLECSEEMLAVPNVDPMLYFKAISHALADCLNI